MKAVSSCVLLESRSLFTSNNTTKNLNLADYVLCESENLILLLTEKLSYKLPLNLKLQFLTTLTTIYELKVVWINTLGNWLAVLESLFKGCRYTFLAHISYFQHAITILYNLFIDEFWTRFIR